MILFDSVLVSCTCRFGAAFYEGTFCVQHNGSCDWNLRAHGCTSECSMCTLRITELSQLDEPQDARTSPFFASNNLENTSDAFMSSSPQVQRLSFFNRRRRSSRSSREEPARRIKTVTRTAPKLVKGTSRCIACSENAAVIIAGYQCGQVWLYLESQSYHPIQLGAAKEITQVACSADGSVVAYASKTGSIRVFETSTKRPLTDFKMKGFEYARGVALSADGSQILASFAAKNGDRGKVVRYYLQTGLVQDIWLGHSKAYEVFCSYDSTRVLLLLQYGNVMLMDTTLAPEAQQLCSFSYMKGGFCSAMNARGDRIVIMSAYLYVHSIHPNDCQHTRVDDFTPQSLRRCDIDAEGSRIIEMRKDSILIRNPTYGSIIGELQHSDELKACAISGNGSRVVALDKHGAMILWEASWLRKDLYPSNSSGSTQSTIPQTSSGKSSNLQSPPDFVPVSSPEDPPKLPIPEVVGVHSPNEKVPDKTENAKASLPLSPLESLFSDALRGHVFPRSALISALREDTVKSLSALICGHNLLLLAFRMGILCNDENAYLFFEELYLPAAELVNQIGPEESCIVKKILKHAEHLGFIKSGESVLALSRAYMAIGEEISKLNTILQEWGKRISILEALTSEHDVRLQTVEKQSEQHLRATAILAKNLTLLHDNMKRQNRALMFANIAKCLLSLLPVIGSAVGNAAFSATEVIINMSAEDLMSVGVSLAHSAIDQAANLDVSNIQVLSYVLKNQEVRRQLEENSFRQVQELSELLQSEIERKARENPKGHLLDLSHAQWREASVEIEREVPVSKVYQEAATFYDRGDKKSRKGTMSCDGAVADAAYFLNKYKGIKRAVPEESLHDELEKIAGEDALRVNRHEFASVCDIMHRRLMQTPEWWLEQFKVAAEPHLLLSIRSACKVLERIWNHTEDLNRARFKQLPARKELEKMLLMFDFDRDRHVNCDEFCKTAHYLIHSTDASGPS